MICCLHNYGILNSTIQYYTYCGVIIMLVSFLTLNAINKILIVLTLFNTSIFDIRVY